MKTTTEQSKNAPQSNPRPAPHHASKKLSKISKKFGHALLLSCGLAVTGCELPEVCAAPAPTANLLDLKVPSNPETTKYINILNSYPNLTKVRDTLASMQFSRNHQPENGYQIVMNLLANHYNPSDDFQTNRKNLTERLKNVDAPAQIYILRVATSLWTEANQIVPWSLKDYSEYEIETMFFVPSLQGSAGECRPSIPVHNQIDQDNNGDYHAEESDEIQLEIDASYQLFSLANKLKALDQEKTIVNTIRWIKGNFFHIYEDEDGSLWSFDIYGDGRPDSERKVNFVGDHKLFAPANLERLFEERASGCHEPVIVLAGILRSLNIPVFNVNLEGHGVSFLPTLNKFVHGDTMSDNTPVPTEMLLFTPAEIMENIENDGMMRHYLVKQLENKYGEEDSWYFKGVRLGRQKDSFYLMSYDLGVQSNSALADLERELPQYHIVMNGDNGENIRVHINTLAEISYQLLDIWDPTKTPTP